MKLLDAVLLSLSVAFFIMGLHQIMTVGFANGYWAVMISTVLLFALIYSRTVQNRALLNDKRRSDSKRKSTKRKQ